MNHIATLRSFEKCFLSPDAYFWVDGLSVPPLAVHAGRGEEQPAPDEGLRLQDRKDVHVSGVCRPLQVSIDRTVAV